MISERETKDKMLQILLSENSEKWQIHSLYNLIHQYYDSPENQTKPPMLVGLDPEEIKIEMNKCERESHYRILLMKIIEQIRQAQGEQFVSVKRDGHKEFFILDKQTKTLTSEYWYLEENADAVCSRLNAEAKKKKEKPKYEFMMDRSGGDSVVVYNQSEKEGEKARGHVWHAVTIEEAKEEIRKWLESE